MNELEKVLDDLRLAMAALLVAINDARAHVEHMRYLGDVEQKNTDGDRG